MKKTKTGMNTEAAVNKKVKRLANTLLVGMFALAVIWTFAACSALPGGFNRSTAAGLIEKDKKYKAPATISVRRGLSRAEAPQTSPDEVAESAVPRAKDDFAWQHPQLIVAEQLGYVKLHFEDAKLTEPGIGKPGYKQYLYWSFQPRAEMTDKGRALWKDLDLPVNEDTLPLATRGTPEVNTLEDENQGQRASDFTYKWVTNELGAAFDENSPVFKNLKPNIQKWMREAKFDLLGQGNNRLLDIKVPRAAKATFKRFDDGWRLSYLYFM